MDSAARRLTLLALAAVGYAAVTTAFTLSERPGLGIGHFYYVPVVLVALATGPYLGAAGGLLAVVLYDAGIIANAHLPSTVEIAQTAIRLITYVLVGVLIGYFSRRNRDLVAELSQRANRDDTTGLPNTREFEAAIERRLVRAAPFALLIADVDELREINMLGEEAGDAALRRLADRMVASKRPGDEIARVGGDEFAILAALDGEDGRELALTFELQLAHGTTSVTFGWATFPRDGENALALYRAADERLYARKLSRGYRRGVSLEPVLDRA